MREPFLLSGDSSAAPFVQSQSRSRSGLIRAVIAIWLLAGLGLAGVKLVSGKHEATGSPVRPATSSDTATSNEDLLRHVEALNSKLSEASVRIRRAQDQIERSLPAVEQNYLFVERQHLSNALAAAEAARLDLEQSRQDAELVLNSLKKEQTNQ